MLPAALRHPELFAALIEREPIGCRAHYREEHLPALAGVAFLSLFGDYLEGTMWQAYAEECRELAEKLEHVGGAARHLVLPDIGISGNTTCS